MRLTRQYSETHSYQLGPESNVDTPVDCPMPMAPDIDLFLERCAEESAKSCEQCARALFEDAGCPVAVLDSEGEFLVCNRSSRVLLLGEDRMLIGARLEDLFPHAYAQERLALLRQAIATGEPVRIRSRIRGVEHVCVMRPLPSEADEPATVLIVCVPSAGRLPADALDAKEEDWGQLAVLSPREREVLGLIGDGLSTAQMAHKLHRGVKTIETHRASISRKLGVRSRARLAQIALLAGLCSPPTMS